MRLNSLASRFFATSLAWTLLVLPIAGFAIYELYRADVQAGFDETLKKLVTQINVDSLGGEGSEPVSPTNRFEPLFEVTHSGWYWQIKPLDHPDRPRLVSASLATASLDSPEQRGVRPDLLGMRWLNVRGPAGEPVRIVELISRVGLSAGQPRYSVVVAGPLDWLDELVTKFRNRLSIALALAGAGLVGVTWLQVRFGLLPLQRIERGLAAIRSGEATRLEGDIPAEIEPLQVELNALIKSNQDIIERARTQVGNLAHALKTPLAVITNEARDDKTLIGPKIVEQAAIMRDQVNHYLDRARMAARVGVIGRVTLIEPTVAPIVRTLERIYGDRGVAIEVTCAPGAQFQGEKHDLEEMLGNLLENACKWAHSAVFLTVSLTGDATRGGRRRVNIAIEDDGAGLSDTERALLGKRGTRLDESKPGSGLGLSIVADLAQSYQGSLTLLASERGGLLARLDLPSS